MISVSKNKLSAKDVSRDLGILIRLAEIIDFLFLSQLAMKNGGEWP